MDRGENDACLSQGSKAMKFQILTLLRFGVRFPKVYGNGCVSSVRLLLIPTVRSLCCYPFLYTRVFIL